MPKDPVCGMEISPQDAIKLEKDGKTFYFCSQNCKNKFLGKDEMKMDHKMHVAHKHAEKGHAAHHAHMVEDFKRRFWISLILTIPVLILSPLIQSLLRFSYLMS